MSLESRVFLLVLLCIGVHCTSWEENHEKFIAGNANLIGSVDTLSSLGWMAGNNIACYCGQAHKGSPFPILLRTCPACHNTNKPKPYFSDYLVGMLASKGMSRPVAESYIACAIAAMENGNV